MINNLDSLEKSLGLESGKLQEMISSEEEHSLSLDNYIIDTKDNISLREENLKKEAKQAGLEIAIKNARNDLGLEFEGKKDLNPLLEAYKSKIESEAKVEPNERYDTLLKDFKALQVTRQEWEDKFNNLDSTYKQKEQQRTIDSNLLKSIPDNTTIPKDDILAILKSRTDFQVGEKGVEVLKNGQVVKNEQTLDPLSLNDYMTTFVKPYLKEPQGGAGGKDSKSGGNETSLDLFDKRMEAQGINVGSAQYNAELSKAIGNGTLKL